MVMANLFLAIPIPILMERTSLGTAASTTLREPFFPCNDNARPLLMNEEWIQVLQSASSIDTRATLFYYSLTLEQITNRHSYITFYSSTRPCRQSRTHSVQSISRRACPFFFYFIFYRLFGGVLERGELAMHTITHTASLLYCFKGGEGVFFLRVQGVSERTATATAEAARARLEINSIVYV